MIDGENNRVAELHAVRPPTSATNRHGNAFTQSRRTLARESEAQRLAERQLGRVWGIVNPSVQNRLGYDVRFSLFPQGNPVLLAADDSSIAGRATLATRHLWVTAFDPAERYPAGDLVNRRSAGCGVPRYRSGDRSLDNTDLVVWRTFGLTHFPRTEDWPIMPVGRTGFTLKPTGFFDRNPTLDVPAIIARLEASQRSEDAACSTSKSGACGCHGS